MFLEDGLSKVAISQDDGGRVVADITVKGGTGMVKAVEGKYISSSGTDCMVRSGTDCMVSSGPDYMVSSGPDCMR